MRPGHTALLVVAATGIDQHVEAVDVQEIAAYFDVKDRGLRIHRQIIAPVPGLERRQILAGDARHGKLHRHPAFSLADALDLELAQVPPHERSPAITPRNTLIACGERISRGSNRGAAAYHHRARDP